MESKHGRSDDMEERSHVRQKSKVPRTRLPQRCEYPDYAPSHHGPAAVKGVYHHHQGANSVSNHHQNQYHQSSETDECKEWQKLIGERVCISGVKQGILRYYGRTNFAQGFWCGVELDEPVGKNNGTVNGVVYFSCKPNHGIFAPVSKVSRLNDLSGVSDWRTETTSTRRESFATRQQHPQEHFQSKWDCNNVRYVTETVVDQHSKFIRNSSSDPSFMIPAAQHRSSLPHKSESFPYDKRSITEQREEHETSSFSVKDLNYELSGGDMTSRRGASARTQSGKNNSSCILTKYGYGANKTQFFSSSNSVVCSSSSSEKTVCGVSESAKDQQTVPEESLSSSSSVVPKKTSSQSLERSPSEEFERYLRTPTNSGEASPQDSNSKRFGGIFDYKIPEELLNAFQSRDFPDPEDDLDNDDQMSCGDFDESLGILTPSQMRDFTLCPDLPTSYGSSSDIMRGIDNFPSSESFDDINDLPEDEQVRDVSVQFLPESSSATKVLEVAKKNGVGSFAKEDDSSSMVSSTDKFLFSISQKDYGDDLSLPESSSAKKVLDVAKKNGVGSFAQKSDNNESTDKFFSMPQKNNYGDFDMPEASSATKVLEVAKKIGVGTFTRKGDNNDSMVSSTDKFLRNISQKNYDDDDFNIESRYLSDASKKCESVTAVKLNNLSAINVLSSSRVKEKELPDKLNNLGFDSLTCAKESMLTTAVDNLCPKGSAEVTFSQFTALASVEQQTKIQLKRTDDSFNLSDSNKMALRNFSEVDVVLPRKNYDTDSSRDSLLQAESENSAAALKEKPTVSWEDCVSQGNSEIMFPPVERPESVYTVASSDTGFQEDEQDGGMVTSLDSTEGAKRFSTISRDSCIDMDGYKIAESNSTSGYSTGLSDSCCNDRAEDDISSKPLLTDEEIQDSVGPCDSEDAFSFNENSLSKDGEVGTAEMSEVTVETVTALCHDSTSDALCETMVEDTTLTEIHDLLLSPEDNAMDQDKENNVIEQQPKEDPVSESSSIKTTDNNKTASSLSASAKSTPDKKLNVSNKAKSEAAQRSGTTTSANNNKNLRNSSRLEDRKKQQQQQLQLAKSPKKNVMSKIKAMIEATTNKSNSSEQQQAVQKRVPSVPKRSRWEAVTSKIAASLAEEKTKPKAKREIKSRVDTNLALARQHASLCRSPKLDRSGEGSMSPVSVSSRRPLSERNSAPNSVKDGRGRVTTRDAKHGAKSPRPSKACITSRSNSPVAASESSTSISLTSHNSRSKIAHWKGSSSTVASSAAPATVTVKRQSTVPPTKPPLQTTRTGRMVTKKPSSEQPGSRGVHASTGKGPVRPPMWLSKAELTQEIQRLGTLCEARTKELNRLKMETKHVSVGFDAFAALFKYMVEDLNGLTVPALTEDLGKTLKQLELTKQDLAYYEREVEEMKSHHCQELNDLSNKLFEVYQSEVAELNAKHQEEINHLKSEHQNQIEHLKATFDASSAEAKAHHEKMIASLEQEIINQREELQAFQEREIRDLEEKHAESSKLLQDHIEQLQKKCAELKQHSMSMEDAMRKDTDSKLQWVTTAKLDIEKEVESLKAVLEMKNKELHTLRIQNLEMEKQLEELPFAREKIKMLQARAEDLEALMVEKTKIERKLSSENQQMRETYEKESKVNRRLSMENEELQWRLRQAENSLISGSFSEVPEFPEAEENGVTSPTKSPPQILSRSVFFTFVDKDESSPRSPRTQYKKITPNFSANYKTSPAKSSKSPPAPSPRRGKSHSEPPQPPIAITSTPRKVAKQPFGKTKGPQKRQRSESDSTRPGEHAAAEVNFSSVTESMASSVSSESSVFEHRERLLEEHKEHIIHSLEILREQRSTEGSVDEPATASMDKKWCSDDIKVTGELSNLEREDMSRSAEFSDPKTYYHMTFPVLKESGITDCDIDDGCKNSSSGNSPVKEAVNPMHSMSENNIHRAVEASDNATLQVMSMSSHEVGSSAIVRIQNKRISCTESSLSAENVQNEAASDGKTENRWRTI